MTEHDLSASATGVAGMTMKAGRAVPPIMVRSHAVSSIDMVITRTDGQKENRSAGSRYGWDSNGRPLRVDYETFEGVESIRGWEHIEPWEMP